MAGITNAEFLNRVIPYGFDVVTLGGYSLDEKTIEASQKIIQRGRKEFHFEIDEIIPHIQNEVNSIKKNYPDVAVSANVRSTVPEPIVEASKIKGLDIIEINCHCRQEEITAIGCGQEMLKRDDLSDYLSYIVDNSKIKVSVKIRANVDGIDTLNIAKIIEDAGVDYLHLDAMDPNVLDADWKLLKNVCNNTNIRVIGNNSIDSTEKIRKMYQCGVYGFSIARSVISGTLNFDISNF
jgi:TIM-barrel protein